MARAVYDPITMPALGGDGFVIKATLLLCVPLNNALPPVRRL